MAVKDHSLDDKITEAAKAEFLKNGFENTSLQTIVKRAGITTGALYTRYSGKDELFSSLIAGLKEDAACKSQEIRELYMRVREEKTAESFILAMETEMKVYIDMLFNKYDECVLMFCKSDGSSVKTMLDRVMDEKAKETVKFLKDISGRKASLDGVDMIIKEQFNLYKNILIRGKTKEQTVKELELVEAFNEAGWKYLFDKIM